MIEELKVSGFRSLKDVTWRPGRLNVVIGPNGSGKSNLLRALELLSTSAKGKSEDYVQSQGGINAIEWDGRAKSLSFHVKLTQLDSDASNEIPDLLYEFFIASRPNNVFNFIQEAMYIDNQSRRKYLLYLDSGDAQVWDESNEINMSVEHGNGNANSETLLSQFRSPFIVNQTVKKVQEELTNYLIYQDIYVGPTSIVRNANVTRYEKQVNSDGQNLVTALHTLYTSDREFKESVDNAVRAAFGEDFDELTFPPASDQRIQMRIRWKTLKREQSTADLSDGTLRFLFLIAVLANPNPPPLIAIDEPETGLHPSMLPIIAEYAVNTALKTQVIFTTHSDQFLDAFRETAEQPTVTVANWVNGETTLATLDDEALSIWLRQYSLGTLYRSGELESEIFK